MADPPSQPHFDVFLSHNSKDKAAVIALARRLQASGVTVWLDAWELRPGHPWQEALEKTIKTIGSAAVLVGKDGLGPWEDVEMRALLNQFVKRKLPVIPVLLPDCPKQPDLPLLLHEFTWVDCRDGGEEEGFSRLVWGITGVKPATIQPHDLDKPEEKRPNEVSAHSPPGSEGVPPATIADKMTALPATGAGNEPLSSEMADSGQAVTVKANESTKEIVHEKHEIHEIKQSVNRVVRFFASFLPRNRLVVALLALGIVIWQLLQPEATKPEGLNTTAQSSEHQVAAAETKPSAQPVAVPVVSQPVPNEPVMAHLTGGEFWMGSDKKDDYLAFDYELPRHKVTVQPFNIGKYEVTVGEYRVFAEATKRPNQGCTIYSGSAWSLDANKYWRDPGFQQTDRHPVVCVSHQDAEAYAAWLKDRTGKPYRLPSEAEWEYAARAGTTTPWYWPGGEQAAGAYAWYSENSGNTTHPVGGKQPNGFDLYDIAGNAWEWVEDSWHQNYQGAPTDGSAWVAGNSAYRVLRGGSWIGSGRRVRSAYRGRYEPGFRNDFIGFRLALGQSGQ